MILAGDIGGTKTNLALYDWRDGRVEPIRTDTFYSADYARLEDVIAEFLDPPQPEPIEETEQSASDESGNEPSKDAPAAAAPKEPLVIDAACFGVAGPVIDNRCQTTNLPWVISGADLATTFKIPHVRLLNDLEATAHGLLLLRTDEIVTLNAGTPPKSRRCLALIAAGTGLGEAILVWTGQRYQPFASEGGHCDFAPNSDLEIELLRYLRGQFVHVSYERVVSGPGLMTIYEFLRDTKKNEPTWLAEKIRAGDGPAVISEAGLTGQADIAKQALELFASIYGAEAGNLALKAMSLDGIYLGGGIAPKLLKKLQDGTFMRGFTNKGRYKRLMSSIPVRVITNQHTALLGAASMASQLARGATT
ncbi:MAG: glucokinase [Nitrospiraceae bacterium]